MASALIGRRAELSWLRARVDLALGGFAHLVIVEGESGIGKTRLAHEALEHARRRRAAVQRGRCYDHLDLPYLPLRDSLLTAVAQSLTARGRHADAELVERARVDIDLTRLADTSSPETLSPEVIQRERTRELFALTDLVLEHVRIEPTVVFVDDVDWADTATIDLLRHLLFRLDDEQVPLLVLATSRADPAARAADGVSRLRSEPRTAVVHLNPLTALEATELLRQREPGAALDRARNLAAASGGNPLLIEALARDRRATGIGPAPAHPIVAAIGTTLDALSPAAARVVLTVAVLGPDAQRRRVLAISEADDDALDEAIVAGVLVEDGRKLAFSHPVYAHTAYDRASLAARRDLHQEAASILLEPRAIAHHLVAGDAVNDAEALERVRAAGNDALARGEWNEAARYYEAALARAAVAERDRRAPPSRRAQPPRQPATGTGRRPLRERTRAPGRRCRRRDPHRAAPLAHPVCDRHARAARRGARPRTAGGVGRRGRGRVARARGRGAGRAVAVVLGGVAHEAGRAVRRAGDGDRGGERGPLGVRPGDHGAERPAVGALRPAGIAGHAGGRRRARTRRARRLAARRRSGVPRAVGARVAGSLRRGRGARARVLRHRRAHAVPARAGSAAGRAHPARGRAR